MRRAVICITCCINYAYLFWSTEKTYTYLCIMQQRMQRAEQVYCRIALHGQLLWTTRRMGPSIYDVHTEGGRASGSGGRMWTGGGGWGGEEGEGGGGGGGGGGSSPMWTSTEKIKIRVY